MGRTPSFWGANQVPWGANYNGANSLRGETTGFQQQRRRRLRQRHLKSEFAPLQTLSRLSHLVYFVKCWQMFLELNSKGVYQSSGKEKKVVVLGSRPRPNVNSGIFTLQSGNDGKEMYKKAWCKCKVVVLLIKPIVFLLFSLPSASSLLKLPNLWWREGLLEVKFVRLIQF